MPETDPLSRRNALAGLAVAGVAAGSQGASAAPQAPAGGEGFSQAASYRPGTIGAKLKQTVSVKDPPFNATGDGRSDDTRAFAAALDSSAAVRVPHGTYRLSGRLVLGEVNALIGDGSDSSVLMFDGEGDGIVVGGNFRRLHLSGLNLRCASPRGGRALALDTGSRGYLADIQITATRGGRWAFGVWASNWQTSNFYAIRIGQSCTIGVHLEYGCNANQWFGLEVIGSSGPGTIDRAVEMASRRGASREVVSFEEFFHGGTFQGFFRKSAIHAAGVAPLMSGVHIENTNPRPSDGADVWLDGRSPSAIVNAKFAHLQGGSFGTAGIVRNLSIAHSEVGDIALGPETLETALLGVRYGSLNDRGGATTVLGCSNATGGGVPAVINGSAGLSVRANGGEVARLDGRGLLLTGAGAPVRLGGGTTSSAAFSQRPLGYMIATVGGREVRIPYYPA